MDNTPNRASSLPRPTKLPVPKQASGLPKPTSTLPRPSSARPASVIRQTPSRSSLQSSDVTQSPSRPAPARDTNTSRLRASASRDQLHSRSGSNAQTTAPRLRMSASRDSLQSERSSRSSLSKLSHPPVSSTTRAGGVPRRRQSDMSLSTLAQEDEAKATAGSQGSSADDFLFKRRLTLTRRPSESFSENPLPEAAEIASAADDSADASTMEPASEAESVSPTSQARGLKPRPSLSERTMETLAHIPSSPALSKKSSSFFDSARSRSRAGTSNSRPGSSYNSDGSGRIPSRAGSRPGSSAASEAPSFRASTNTFKKPLSTIDGTPRGAAARFGSKPAGTPTVRKASSRASLSSAATVGDAGNTSPVKKTYGALPKSGSKTVASHPTKPRASVGSDLFKKPSLPALDAAAANSSTARENSLDSVRSSDASWDGTIASLPSTASTSTAPTEQEESPKSSFRKSSAALRDQIAKAKAAKRAASKEASSSQLPEAADEAPIPPSDGGFDFAAAYADPFNMRRGENPKQKVLKQKVAAGRTSGRLNIAALGLKEIPPEVMKMYDFESIGANDGSWAESVDLTRLVAADNELERLDDSIFPDSDPGSLGDDDCPQGNIFGGLENIDMHGNIIVNVPRGLRQLHYLTSLNLSSNRLTNDSFETLSQLPALKDLKLAKNLFYGPISSEMSNLSSLEILDLHGNNVSALPKGVGKMSRLRILNLSENDIKTLPFEELADLPLTELIVRKNKLAGTLIEGADSLPQLQTLDASMNQITQLVPHGQAISLPVLHSLCLSMNRLQELPDMTTWTSLLTLTVDENSISNIPTSLTTLDKLRHVDFSSNDIRIVPPEIARMDNLAMIRLTGNPLRDKKFVSITTEELKDMLTSRLEPPPPYQEPARAVQAGVPDFIADSKAEMEGYNSDGEEDFATPPTSAPHSPSRSRSQTVTSLRSRSQTLSNQTWPVKQGGILDRTKTESSSLHPVVCSRVAAEHRVKQVMLPHNLFTCLPDSLSFFADTLSVLSLAHNQLMGETYLSEHLDFPALKELNVSSNRITGLDPLLKNLVAPMLEKLDVSMNRINALPKDPRSTYPKLSVLLASNNQIAELDPETIRGMKIVDVSSNDLSHLNPKIGLLGGSAGLQRLEVMGNRFRVPRYSVLERGTEATLRWLRGRVPVAETAAWRAQEGNDSPDGTDLD